MATLLARAIARRLSPAEWYMIVESGGRQVDHDQSRLRIALKIASIFQRGRADTRRQAELRIVRDRQRLIIALDPNDRRDGTENLLSADTHGVSRFDE